MHRYIGPVATINPIYRLYYTHTGSAKKSDTSRTLLYIVREVSLFLAHPVCDKFWPRSNTEIHTPSHRTTHFLASIQYLVV